jgi:hypothetical protein
MDFKTVAKSNLDASTFGGFKGSSMVNVFPSIPVPLRVGTVTDGNPGRMSGNLNSDCVIPGIWRLGGVIPRGEPDVRAGNKVSDCGAGLATGTATESAP